jgi:hypothetical protein
MPLSGWKKVLESAPINLRITITYTKDMNTKNKIPPLQPLYAMAYKLKYHAA